LRSFGAEKRSNKIRNLQFGFGGDHKSYITRNCRNLIRTLPAMTYDKTHPEDIDPACEEHAVKALMYGLTRRKMQVRLLKVRGL
jgi:hypothetical protein